jgi:2-aminoadipate transaminase
MRLNFSGVVEDDIHEGVRRIGKIVREQVGLYGTLTGVPAAPPARGQPAAEHAAAEEPSLAKVLRLPEPGSADRADRAG